MRAWREVYVWSPDTDVLTLLLDLVARNHSAAETRLKLLAGKGTKYRQIDVIYRASSSY